MRNRCLAIFEGKGKMAEEVVQEAFLLGERHKAVMEITVVPGTAVAGPAMAMWQRPAAGMVKINVDGAW